MINKAENVKTQYANDKNLATRLKLHTLYSTNPQGFVAWLFTQYAFAENDRVLELGCGNGFQWEGHSDHLPKGATLLLSDFSGGMVSLTREKFLKNENISVEQIDIQSIPYGDGTFDVVIANHMLYHVPDLPKALGEVRRVLKPSGRFYASTNSKAGMFSFLRQALLRIDPHTQAFAGEPSFHLENGEALLQPYFARVTRADFEDALAITCTQDLVDWIQSTISLVPHSINPGRLYQYFEAIRQREGAIVIPKRAGIFIANQR